MSYNRVRSNPSKVGASVIEQNNYEGLNAAQLKSEIKERRVDIKQSSERSRRLAEEAAQIGDNTVEELKKQDKQIDRIQMDAEDVEYNLKRNRKVVKDMKRNWLSRLCCYNREDVLPPEPDWNREDEEEKKKVERVIKAEKKKRANERRKKAAKDAMNGRKPGSSEAIKIKLPGESSDSSDFSDTESVDEGGVAGETAAERSLRLKQKQMEDARKFGKRRDSPTDRPRDEYDLDSDTFEDEVDEDLDATHLAVLKMKQKALETQQLTAVTSSKIQTLQKTVEKDQAELDVNQKEIKSLLGRRARLKAEQREQQQEMDAGGLLSMQDKMALDILKQSAAGKLK